MHASSFIKMKIIVTEWCISFLFIWMIIRYMKCDVSCLRFLKILGVSRKFKVIRKHYPHEGCLRVSLCIWATSREGLCLNSLHIPHKPSQSWDSWSRTGIRSVPHNYLANDTFHQEHQYVSVSERCGLRPLFLIHKFQI